MTKDLGRIPTVEEIEHVVRMQYSTMRSAADPYLNDTGIKKIAEKVLELITDDPSKDLVGTVRVTPEHGYPFAKHSVADIEDHCWFGVRLGGTLHNASVRGWPIIGTVPGTPAWDAEQAAQKGDERLDKLVTMMGWALINLLKMSPTKLLKNVDPIIEKDFYQPGFLFVWTETTDRPDERKHFKVRLGEIEPTEIVYSRGN